MSTIQIRDKLTGIVKNEKEITSGTHALQKDCIAVQLAKDIGIDFKHGLYALDDLYITEINDGGTCLNKWDFEHVMSRVDP